MKFNLAVEIDDLIMMKFLKDNPLMTLSDLKGELNNACYLGLGCIETIVLRQLGIEVNDTYVEKAE